MSKSRTLLTQMLGSKSVLSQARQKALLRFAKTKPLGAISLVILLIVVIVAIFREPLAPYDPLFLIPDAQLTSPNAQYWMGTDNYGRDIFSRIIHGAWISLYVGIGSVILLTTMGTAVGLTSGFYGGKFDLWVQRLMDGLMAFPTLLLAILVMSILGQGLNNVVLVIALVSTPALNRVVRGTTLSVKESDYITAARCIGASEMRIASRHVLPNVVAPIIIVATSAMGSAILIEASLSFLGLGTPPPIPSWGGELAGHARDWMMRAPWMAVFPGLTLGIVVLAINLLGDALRDVLDPRLRGSQ